MPQRDLLDLVNSILSDGSSDRVNHIVDTIEAEDVAYLLKDLYYSFVTDHKVPGEKAIFQLEATADLTKPTRMRLPDGTDDVYVLNYDVRLVDELSPSFREIKWQDPEDFLQSANGLTSTDTNVLTTTENGVTILIKTDEAPTYYTSFDDEYIIFNSYDSAVESTLQQSKTQVLGRKEHSFTIADDFIPSIPSDLVPGFLAEAKSRFSFSKKQEVNQPNVQEGRRYAIKSKADGNRTGNNSSQRNDFSR